MNIAAASRVVSLIHGPVRCDFKTEVILSSFGGHLFRAFPTVFRVQAVKRILPSMAKPDDSTQVDSSASVTCQKSYRLLIAPFS
jgi:hypothetical protein